MLCRLQEKNKETEDILSKLSKFEEEADKREELHEMKRLEFKARIEKRQQMELQHEKLMSMFMSL